MTTPDDLFFTRTGLDRERVSSLVGETLNDADDGELFMEFRQSEALGFDDGRLKTASFDTNQGFGLRCVAGESTGYAHASELSEAALKRASEAVQAVKTGHTGVTAEGPSRTNTHLYTDENPLGAQSFEEKVKLLAEIDAYARAKDARVQQVSASLAGEWQAVEIIRADGSSLRDVRPLVRLNVAIVAGDGDRQETGSYGVGGRTGLRDLHRSAETGRRRSTRRVRPGARQSRQRARARRRDGRGAGPRLARHPAP